MAKKIIKEVSKKVSSKSIESTKYLGSQFKNHAATAVIAAFSLLIALSWRDFIVKIVEEATKTNLFAKYPYLSEFFTAIIITIIAIIGITIISKWAKNPEAEQ